MDFISERVIFLCVENCIRNQNKFCQKNIHWSLEEGEAFKRNGTNHFLNDVKAGIYKCILCKLGDILE